MTKGERNMTDYKLVPVEPTPEMVEAAEDAYMPFGDMDLALRMAILAAPAVQGEPVAWLVRERLFCGDVTTDKDAAEFCERLTPGSTTPLYTRPSPVQVPDKSNLHDKLIFVGYTNGCQILYANDYGHGAEGLFFKDTDSDCVIPLYMLRTHYHRLESTSFGQVTLALLNKAQRDTSQPAEQEKPTRQYYYRMDSCKSLSPGSDQCICWHDEGEGPLADGSAKHWRSVPIKPTEQQPAPDVAGLVEALDLALEYWRDRQQRYKNRRPKWVIAAESALATYRKGGEA